jgi:hypothetical protein
MAGEKEVCEIIFISGHHLFINNSTHTFFSIPRYHVQNPKMPNETECQQRIFNSFLLSERTASRANLIPICLIETGE